MFSGVVGVGGLGFRASVFRVQETFDARDFLECRIVDQACCDLQLVIPTHPGFPPHVQQHHSVAHKKKRKLKRNCGHFIAVSTKIQRATTTQHKHSTELALCPQCHPVWASEGTLVGPSKDTHGTPVPTLWEGRGWLDRTAR